MSPAPTYQNSPNNLFNNNSNTTHTEPIMNIARQPSSEVAVWRTLDVDRQYREAKEDGDLHCLNSLRVKEWDYSLPTIEMGPELYTTTHSIKNYDYFVQTFYRLAPELKDANLNNFLIAGGFPSHIVNRRVRKTASVIYQYDDIDIFVYGLSESKANERVEEMVDHICKFWSSKDNKQKIIVRKHKHVLTLFNSTNARKIQLIFRLYNTISEILHGFDMGSSAIGFDGKQVYLTSMGKFSFEYMCNIVDPSKISSTFAKRISKYCDRGFKIIMPYLDMKKVHNDFQKVQYILELPFLKFGITTLYPNHNRIIANCIFPNFSNKRTKQLPGNSFELYYKSNYMEVTSSKHASSHNIKRLLNGASVDSLVCYDDTGTCLNSETIFALTPNLDWDTFCQKTQKGIWNEKTGIFNFKKFQQVSRVASGQDAGTFLAREGFFLSESKRASIIDSIVTKSIKEMKDKVEKAKIESHICWIKDDPTCQFHPIYVTAVEFYGNLFKKNFDE